MRKYGSSFDAVNPAVHSLTEIIAEFQRVNISSGDAMEFFGERAGRAMLALTNIDQDQLTRLGTTIRDNFGEGAKQAAVRWENVAGLIAEGVSRIEAIKLTVFNAIEKDIVRILSIAVDWLTKLSEAMKMPENQQFIASLARIGAILSILLVTLGAVGLALGSIAGVIGTLTVTFASASMQVAITEASIAKLETELEQAQLEALKTAAANTELAASYTALAIAAGAAGKKLVANTAAARATADVVAAQGMFGAIMPMLKQAFLYMGQFLAKFATTIATTLVIVGVIVSAIETLSQLAAEGAGKFGMLSGLVEAISSSLRGLWSGVMAVYDAFESLTGSLGGTAKTVMYELVEQFRILLEVLQPLFPLIGAIAAIFIGGPIVAGMKVFKLLVIGISGAISFMLDIVNGLVAGLAVLAKGFMENRSLSEMMFDAYLAAFGGLVANIMDLIGTLAYYADYVFMGLIPDHVIEKIFEEADKVRKKRKEVFGDVGIETDSQEGMRERDARGREEYNQSTETNVVRSNLLDRQVQQYNEMLDLQKRYDQLTGAELDKLAQLKDSLRNNGQSIEDLKKRAEELIEVEKKNRAFAEETGQTQAVRLHDIRIEKLQEELETLKELDKANLEFQANKTMTTSAEDRAASADKLRWDKQTRDLAEARKAAEEIESKYNNAFEAATKERDGKLTGDFNKEMARIKELEKAYMDLSKVKKDALTAQETVLDTSVATAQDDYMKADANLQKATAEANQDLTRMPTLSRQESDEYVRKKTEAFVKAKEAASKRLDDLTAAYLELLDQQQAAQTKDAEVQANTAQAVTKLYADSTEERNEYLLKQRIAEAEAKDDIVQVATLKAQEYIAQEQKRIDEVFDINDAANAQLKAQAEQAMRDRAKLMIDEANKKLQEQQEKEAEEKRNKLKAQMKEAMSPLVSASNAAADAAAKQVKSVQDLINLYTVLYKIRMFQEARAREAADRAFQAQQKVADLEAKIQSGKYSGSKLQALQGNLQKAQFQQKMELAVAGTKLAIAGIDPTAASVAQQFTGTPATAPSSIMQTISGTLSATYIVVVEIRDLLRSLILSMKIGPNAPLTPAQAAGATVSGSLPTIGSALGAAAQGLLGGGGFGNLGFAGMAAGVPFLSAAATSAVTGKPATVPAGAAGTPGDVTLNVNSLIDLNVAVDKFKGMLKNAGFNTP
jgi:hypothetical protein